MPAQLALYGGDMAATAVASGSGSLLLLAMSAATGERWTIPGQAATWTAFAFLVLAGSVGFFVLYLITVKRWTASGVSYQFVLWPLVAVAVSAWLEGEQVSWTLVLGGAIVIAGVYVGALMQSGARSSEGADAQDLQRPRPEAKV